MRDFTPACMCLEVCALCASFSAVLFAIYSTFSVVISLICVSISE